MCPLLMILTSKDGAPQGTTRSCSLETGTETDSLIYCATTKLDTWRFYSIKQVSTTVSQPNWTHGDSTQSSRLVLLCHNQTGHMKILLNQAGYYYSATTKLDTWRFHSIKQVNITSLKRKRKYILTENLKRYLI